MRKITSAASERLHDIAATRLIESAAASELAPHVLMQRAGLAVARLAQALAPHARLIWIACGPGNNGGDGFEAALHLHRWGRQVALTWTGPRDGRNAPPPDAQASRQRAIAAGVPMLEAPPTGFDFCIDALLGLGARPDDRTAPGVSGPWLEAMDRSGAACLCVDLPTGLDGDTGESTARPGGGPASERHTLSLLTLKPGLFTANGRDLAGDVWFDDLRGPSSLQGSEKAPPDATAWLLGADRAPRSPRHRAAHASHKGSFGDVAIIGGESTGTSHMSGAALLAGRAALHAGAGRVMVALLGHAGPTVDFVQPELMFRQVDALDMARQTVVCGCGGGDAVREVLPRVLSSAHRLVLDADALNAIARDSVLQRLLVARHASGRQTVLTPHPLEAARLAGSGTSAVQADRIATAQALAHRFQCTVVLKGSGTVITAPGLVPHINSSGNARLATAGTGDVLAGMVGAWMAGGLDAFDAACGAVFAHGAKADRAGNGPESPTLTASRLVAGFD